ncbi:hypothetical protein MN116_001379 [Schistosoma mekongi]|uniref:Uncharacterized protein n=1 Tax=Schistosoma mekongi TaxID=38744 RepID=A0AAE1ZLG0_SCHME|nr:hypothetical protein MN116_001379 [Schistosoma mekongi]
MEESFEAQNLFVSESPNIDPPNKQRSDHSFIRSKDIHISIPAISVHHRRKQPHVSPLSRSACASNHLEASSYTEYDFPPPKDHVETVELGDEDNLLLSCNHEHFLRSEPTHEEKSVDSLKLTKLDPEFRDLVTRYVCSEYVVHCLELAGYCTPYVVARLDDHQLRRLETFVGHACSIMKSVALREHFVGPIFANDPLKFKLPSGAVCGILLAAQEIRRRYRRTQLPLEDQNYIDEDAIIVPDSCDQSFSDIACQTDSSISHLTTTSPFAVTLANRLATNVVMENSDSTSSTPALNPTSKTYSPDSPNPLVGLESFTAPSTESAVMVAATLQTAVSGSGLSNITLFSNSLPSENNLTTLFSISNSGDSNSGIHSGTSVSPTSSRNMIPIPSIPVVSIIPNTAQTQSSFGLSSSSVKSGNGVFENEGVNLERLKQHSSASAIRLASRQFVNAYLMRGRDFDMEMELSVTPDGFKRVTGIFYCHLCREKRERTSAVRFSIARNRYPVLSNVLSHLKTHFHYRGQTLSESQATVIQQTQSLLKSVNELSEPFIGQGLGRSSGPFTSSYYRTDVTVENATNSSTSFLSPSVSLNLLQSHVKSEPENYTYTLDAEGSEDCNSDHQIIDSVPPSNRLSSPNNSSSAIRSLGLEVFIASEQNTGSNNQCSTLTS